MTRTGDGAAIAAALTAWGRNDAAGIDEYIELDDPVDGSTLPIVVVTEAAMNRLMGAPANRAVTSQAIDRQGLQCAWMRVVAGLYLYDYYGGYTRTDVNNHFFLPVPRCGEGDEDVHMASFCFRLIDNLPDGTPRFLLQLVTWPIGESPP